MKKLDACLRVIGHFWHDYQESFNENEVDASTLAVATVTQKQERAESGLRKHGCVSEWPLWSTNVRQETTKE